jgi:RHS repeat-associated protein
LIFDAWNRLVQVKSGSTVLEGYTYDPLGRRVTLNPGTLTSLYYSSAWQVLEEQSGGSTQAQYVWSPVYVDAMIERDQASTRYYVQQDANYNVTAIVDTSASVKERYIYDPYGKPTFVSADWSTTSASSSFAWVYLHQGGRYDTGTGLYNFRNRDYSPSLGRWTTPDRMGFTAGDTDYYRYVSDDPANALDSMGLKKMSWADIEIPRVIGTRGSARYKVRWRDPGANGVIIQHIVQTVSVYKKGDDEALSEERTTNKPRDFYEAWQVVNGEIWNGPANTGLGTGGADTWSTKSEAERTHGTIVIQGTVQFIPGKQVTGDWLMPGAPDYPPEAGGLPVWPGKRMPPPVQFDDTAATRTLTIKWDDCAEDKTKRTSGLEFTTK